MFVYTRDQLIEKLNKEFKSDDVIGLEYWTYQDVIDFTDGDDYYGDVTDEVAREVFETVAAEVSFFDNVDNDTIRDQISAELDKRRGSDEAVA
jgi:hypothetical protein